MRPLRTNAGPAVTASRVHCRLGRRPLPGGRARRGRASASEPSAAWARSKQVGAFGVVEPQRAGDRFQHGRGDAGEVAAFELGVVLDAHVGQRGDLAAAQPGHTAPGPPAGSPACSGVILARREVEELADFVPVVHTLDGTPPAAVGMYCRYTSHQ